MLIWIAIYSSFTTATFTDEFVLLLSTIEFWGSVVLSVALAIGMWILRFQFGIFLNIIPGPRFISKFFTATYYPTDRELVREMWVLGDLKDQLGIPHRRDRPKKGDLEATPMFQGHYRERSTSDIASLELPYQPTQAAHRSPGLNELDPSSSSKSLTPVAVDSKFVVDENNEWDTETPIQRQPIQPPPSSLSYYSASDIPPPSPLPEQNIYTPRTSRSQSSSNMSSVAGGPVAVGYGTSLQPPSHYSSPRPTPPQTPPAHGTYNAGEYEMRVRSSPRGPAYTERSQSSISHITERTETSFVTAPEGSIDEGYNYPSHSQSRDSETATIRGQISNTDYRHEPWRESGQSQSSQYSVSGPHAL